MTPSRTPRAYSCIRSIQACPLGTTGAYRGHQVCIDGALCLFFLMLIFAHCLNSVLVAKSQQGEYDII